MQRWELLNELWAIQDQHGYVTNADVTRIAGALQISTVEVEGVISFYHFFRRKPVGKFIIYLNDNIIAEMNGRSAVKEAFEKEVGVLWGNTDPLGVFSLFDTSCIGLNDQEPAALINFYPFTKLTVEKAKHIIRSLRDGIPVEQLADRVKSEVQGFIGSERNILIRPFAPGKITEQLFQFTPEQVIETILQSKLTGRGGANFPTGRKWALCRQNPGTTKFIVCNADEGEPGAFKDRFLLQAYPGLVIEGMTAAAYAVGARQGILYLRAEYRYLQDELEAVLQRYRDQNWLGEHIAGQDFSFDIRIQLGAGAYVCGEETSLLESLEGHRGEPRLKIFFPVQKGFQGQPTVVNNVETFAKAARILELGAARFAELGTVQSRGTRLFSVSGDCQKPGIYELEWGVSIKELLAMCEAVDTSFVQVSGPSGSLIPASQFERRLSIEDVSCNGSFMVFNKNRDLLQVISNFIEFFKHESCGVCTPCRVGNFLLSRQLDKLRCGLVVKADLENIQEWGKLMQQASRCGLGQSAPNALLQALQTMPERFTERMTTYAHEWEKGFDYDKAIAPFDKIQKEE